MDFLANVMPRTLNGVMMWIISFLMLFLLFRKYEEAKKKKQKFMNLDNFIILFVFVLTIITFIVYVFILGDKGSVGEPVHVLIPATVYSIILSIVAFATFLFTILYYYKKSPPNLKKIIYTFFILLFFIGLKKINEIFLAPYGTLFLSIVKLIIEVFAYGLLLPFLFTCALLYIIHLLKQK